MDYNLFGFSKEAINTVNSIEAELSQVFKNFEDIELHNQAKVLKSFQDSKVAAHYFNPTTGYGYDDIGRDNLDKLYAGAFDAEAAVVSPHIVSGTSAIYIVLSGLLRPGDTMLSISGRPYDTLADVIGIGESSGVVPCSLAEGGIIYRQVDLTPDYAFDEAEIANQIAAYKPRIAYIQRSRGYAWRNSLFPERMASIISTIHEISSETIVVVDNCYGEFVRMYEPTHYGADIIVGSLIKNAGGGLAPTGGYFAGRRKYVDRIAYRLTAPGIGRETGSYASSYLPYYQGLFLAPHTVCQSLKTAALFAGIAERLGYSVMPSMYAERSDIVQAIRFNAKTELIEFCRCIQSASPVDGHVLPEPWAMPGYENDVIMAAGTFIQGASIELTADAPIREPFTAYMQGSLTYAHGRLAAINVLSKLLK